MQAHRPKHLPKYAEICLDKLAETGLGAKISLGGAFGLMHYHEYRPTHDVDAWWQAKVSAEERRQVADVLRQELAKDDMNSNRARLAVQTHLARIEQHRPLEGITDPSDRGNAERLRGWFREDFFVDLP